MCKQPSKYHRLYFVGEGIKGANEYGYKYSWDSTHPDLTQTKTVRISGVEVCVYCTKKAYPIQAGLRGNGKDYSTTGHTCICEPAEAEREYVKKLKDMEKEFKDKEDLLKKEFKDKETVLKKEYGDKLKINKMKLLEIKHKSEMNRAKMSESDFFNFRGIE